MNIAKYELQIYRPDYGALQLLLAHDAIIYIIAFTLLIWCASSIKHVLKDTQCGNTVLSILPHIQERWGVESHIAKHSPHWQNSPSKHLYSVHPYEISLPHSYICSLNFAQKNCGICQLVLDKSKMHYKRIHKCLWVMRTDETHCIFSRTHPI